MYLIEHASVIIDWIIACNCPLTLYKKHLCIPRVVYIMYLIEHAIVIIDWKIACILSK